MEESGVNDHRLKPVVVHPVNFSIVLRHSNITVPQGQKRDDAASRFCPVAMIGVLTLRVVLHGGYELFLLQFHCCQWVEPRHSQQR